MVSNEEIKRRLEAKRMGIIPEKEENSDAFKKTCPGCGIENSENARFCVGCGESFKETEVHIKPRDIKDEINTKICPACKSKIPENVKFCIECGETLANTETIEDEIVENETPEPPKESLQKESIEALKEPEEPPLKLIIEELILGGEGFILNKNGFIEEWNSEIGILKYEDIENVNFEESSGLGTIEIIGKDANIKIKDIDSDLGNQFTTIAQEKIAQMKLEAETSTESMDKIKKAKELLNIGAITEEEFEKIKKKILEGI